MAGSRGSTSEVGSESASDDAEAEVRRLLAENERLREERSDARTDRYRRGALGFALLGLLSAGAGYVFPESRIVLFSFAGIGLFGAVLTYYLTAAPSDADATTESIYAAYAETLTEMASELGLRDVSVYVPAGDAEGNGVRLFVPQQASFEVPDEPDAAFVASAGDSRRGIAIHPIGAVLFDRFERSLVDPLAESPGGLAAQLSAALVEQFELVTEAAQEYDADNDRVTVLVRGSTLDTLDGFDHPVASFVATGLARGLDRPVRVEVHPREGTETLLVFSFDVGGATTGESGSRGDAEHDGERDEEPPAS